MPTTDPVKRRKQNCENQKRWRQRQIDELRKLRTALEKSDLRVKDLETESGKLRGALQNALDEIGHLRRDPSSAHRQSSQRNGFNTDRPHENRNSSTFAVSISHGTQPSVESNQIASAVSCSKGKVNGVSRKTKLTSNVQYLESMLRNFQLPALFLERMKRTGKAL